MIDFASRRFTIRLGRASKPLKTGEHIARRTSTLGRKTSTRRVSIRNSAVKRASSGAGGLHRGASVRRSQSGLRRGASVKRAPSAARRNSKRMSTIPRTGQLLLPEPASSETAIQATAAHEPEPTASLTSPITSPTSPKSFFSKLTSRFRGRSKVPKAEGNHPSLDLVTQGITGGLTATPSSSNLAPLPPAPRSPSPRSLSPGSRVTFVDTIQPTKSENETSSGIVENGPQPRPALPNVAQGGCSDLPPAIIDDNGDDDGEWVDAEDEADSEPRKSVGVKLDGVDDPMSKDDPTHNAYSGDLGTPAISLELDPFATGVQINSPTEEQPTPSALTGPLQTSLLNSLSHDTSGSDARISQWLADTPLVQIHDQVLSGLAVDSSGISSDASTSTKRESRRPRPPQIIVPTLSSNNPYRVPLPPSPAGPPSTVSETNPFLFLSTNPGLTVDTPNPEETVPPPSPSILLTPAPEVNGFDLDIGRKSSDTLAVDYAQIPLPPSPSPSSMSAAQESEEASPTADKPTVERANSMSTLGGRSLSTAPSTRGPTTPTSMRFPGHPAMAHFSFGGPKSPSLNVEDWEAGEEERRGRSLEVRDGKRRIRSVSPKLDAVQEGDESRRSSKASLEVKEPNPSTEDKPVVTLPHIEENVAFGKKGDADSESEHEDECGFYAFAERQMEEEKKVSEAAQSNAPKRSKTMSFLSVGFGKRKSAIGEPQSSQNPVPRSATSSRLLGLPTPGPKRSSTLMAPSTGGRLMPTQRSSTLLAESLSPREAVSPIIYTAGDIQSEAGKIEDDESRRLCEAAFMF